MIGEKSKVHIERAEEADLQKILDLQYWAYQSEARLVGSFDIPPLKQTLDDLHREYEQGIILKAVDEKGTIIGSVRAYGKDKTVYIGKLMVSPEMQGGGIGTKLLLAIEQEYPNHRCELFTSDKSKRNITLYQRLGYGIFAEKAVVEDLKFVYMEKPPSKAQKVGHGSD